jgi:hypothetical protein
MQGLCHPPTSALTILQHLYLIRTFGLGPLVLGAELSSLEKLKPFLVYVPLKNKMHYAPDRIGFNDEIIYCNL